MPAYNFKKNCKVYLVQGSNRYKIEVYPDISFSQTFEERQVPVKTLHDQNAMFEDAIINKANPANFEFTVELVKGSDFDVIGNWLTQRNELGSDEALTTYDIYVDTGVDIFKIRKCVAERATVQMMRDRLITISLSGSAAQLTRFGISGTAIPGNPQTRDISPTAIIIRRLLVELNSAVMPSIAGITVELSNEVQWLEYETLHSSLYVTGASDVQTPEVFVVSKKVLSGTIIQYLTDENRHLAQSFSTTSTLRVRVGDSDNYYLDVDLPVAIVTTRIQPEDVFTLGYDFRLTYSPNNVSEVFKY